MHEPLLGKISIVTGGRQGIGRAIAERFLEAGALVAVGDLEAPKDLEEWKARSEGAVGWYQLDVASEASVKATVEAVVRDHGGIDILVNNAGIEFEQSLEDQTEAEWDRMMAINLKGPFLMAKHAAPHMRKRGGGAIVNIGSIEGFAVNPRHTAYAASKGGVHGLTVALAIDLGPDGIRCNAICPGWINTDLNRAYVESHPDAKLVNEELSALHPVRRIGNASEVGDVAVWLASGESSFVTGQLITVDGGRTKKLSLPQIFGR